MSDTPQDRRYYSVHFVAVPTTWEEVEDTLNHWHSEGFKPIHFNVNGPAWEIVFEKLPDEGNAIE